MVHRGFVPKVPEINKEMQSCSLPSQQPLYIKHKQSAEKRCQLKKKEKRKEKKSFTRDKHIAQGDGQR